jgi:uncharacterized protein
MIIGVRVMNFSIPENASLKGKRAIVRSAIERASARFNAAVAEVGAQDEHRRAIVGVTVISNTQAHAARMLDEVDEHLSRADGWVPQSKRTEFVSIGVQPRATMGDDLRWADFADDEDEARGA